MRILAVHPGPNFSVSDVYTGWVKAFRQLGCDVADLNYSDRLSFYSSAGKVAASGEFVKLTDDAGALRLASKGIEAAALEFWPDIVFIVSSFFVPIDVLEVLRARGMKVVLMHTEEPYEHDKDIIRGTHASFNVLNDPTHLTEFLRAGVPSLYLPHAYDPDTHCPGPVETADDISEFCFVGTGYPSRVRFFESVDWSRIDAAFAGNWSRLDDDSPLRPFVVHDLDECLDNADAVKLYRATLASANLYRTEANATELEDGWAMGPREVELAATGTFFLRNARGEGDEVLPMLPTFDGPGDFGEKLRWWLAHGTARQECARQAREAVADRTFVNNAKRLLSVLA